MPPLFLFRLVASCLLGMLILWLWHSDRTEINPWIDQNFVNNHIRQMPADEFNKLREEIGRVTSAAGIKLPINLNGSYRHNELNIYIVKSATGADTGLAPGDARYVPRGDLLLIDERVVWPSSSKVLFAAIDVSQEENRSSSAKLWFEFALLHELGHRAMHRNINLSQGSEFAQAEDEADQFAFRHIAPLIDQTYQETGDADSLFAMGRIRSLPEPDRAIATIASAIQSFSVNLLFSNTKFSSYHFDNAHKAFVSRFKPYLTQALGQTITREGATFVLVAFAVLDRVQHAGESIVKEIQSDLPITNVKLTEDTLSIEVALESGAGGARTVTMPLNTVLNSQPSVIPLSATAPKPADNAPQNDPNWWADTALRPKESRVSDNELIDQIAQAFLLEDARRQCMVTQNPASPDQIDVVFLCGGDLISAFSAVYDRSTRKLLDIQSFPYYGEFNGRKTGDVGQLVSVRVNDAPRAFFIRDSLSDTAHNRRHELTVWSIAGQERTPLARVDLLTDWIPTDTKIGEWFRITHPPVLLCQPIKTDILCVEFLDSVFRFSPTLGTLSILFYPAGAKMSANRNGLYAFYAKGGYKLFLSEPAVAHNILSPLTITN